MDIAKTKATDYVVESLKLIVTLSTIFFGGLLAYRANLNAPYLLWAYYSSLAAFSFSAIFSVANINSLINKIFRGDEDAIQHKEAKALNVLAIITLFSGIGFGAAFLSKQPDTSTTPSHIKGAIITDAQISIGAEIESNVEIKKDSNGKISTVTITPKMGK